MVRSIHISTPRQMLNFGNHVDISVWNLQLIDRMGDKSDGSILELKNCISLQYNFYGGWRNLRILASGQCRRVRDVCIYMHLPRNDLDIF